MAVMNANFRSALNGFNRSDVVEYIERISLENEKAQRQLRDETARLQAELDETKSALTDALARLADAEASASVAPEAEESQEAPCAAEAAPVAAATAEQELAAYRRAEAAERAAYQRAARVYAQLRSSFAATAAKLADSDNDLRAIGETIEQNLRQLSGALAALQGVYDGSQQELDELVASLPETED